MDKKAGFSQELLRVFRNTEIPRHRKLQWDTKLNDIQKTQHLIRYARFNPQGDKMTKAEMKRIQKGMLIIAQSLHADKNQQEYPAVLKQIANFPRKHVNS